MADIAPPPAVGPTVGTLYTEAELSQMWLQLQSQVHAFSFVLSIEGKDYRQLDPGALTYLAAKFMAHVKENVIYCRDGVAGDRYYLGPPRFFLAGSGVLIQDGAPGHQEPIWVKLDEDDISNALLPVASPPIKCEKIPRPPNAYILYRTDRHKQLKEAHPELSNNEISSVLGKAWQNESEEIRERYRKYADELKAKLIEKYPDYKYRPRRANERRRRGAANGAANGAAPVLAAPVAAVPAAN